jgi:DNA-binding LytR/AlgR family response regulator
MTSLRVMACDDEPLALDRLVALLARCPDVELVGTSLGGEEAVAELERLGPDLLLLDIEMPKLDGFDIVDWIARRQWGGSPPLVVFVTAHPEYAFEAFDSGAIDFLSKPVRLRRLERALERARVAVERRQSAERLASLMATLDELRGTASRSAQPRHIWVQKKSERVRLDLAAVDAIEAEGEYVRLHANGASYLHRGPLGTLAEQLASESFVRIHRSAVVNSAHVAGIGRSSWGGLVLRMKSGRVLPVGRSYHREVRALIAAAPSE